MKIIVTSDIHFPYEHPDMFEFIQDVLDLYNYKFDLHVDVGDIVDFHSFSNWDKRPDLHGASRELQLAREKVARFAAMFKKIPHLGVIGNHCCRIARKANQTGIPEEALRPLEEIIGVPWKLEEQLIIATPTHGTNKTRNLYVIHDGGSDLRKEVVRSNMNMIAGHYHYTAYIDFQVTANDLVWGLQMPCLIDKSSSAFAYARRQIKRPIIGCAIIDSGHPRLVPMPLDKKGRYKKKELVA